MNIMPMIYQGGKFRIYSYASQRSHGRIQEIMQKEFYTEILDEEAPR